MKITSSIAAFAVCALATSALATTFQSSNGYQISPPTGFTYSPGSNVSYDSSTLHVNSTAFDSFFYGPHHETISVAVGNVPAQLTLSYVIQNMPRELERALTNNNTRVSGNPIGTFQGKTKLRFLSKGYTTIGGTRAATFLSRVEAGPSARTVLVRQVVVLRGGRMLTFCCTSPSNTFWAMAPAFNRTLSTVRWTK